ncbi:uncharacterized protein [Solanum lycopersicum]|uniref:uncharacterized protein n=1 Tax=Solanum lycopersicum TaxID=4081 RepID=UPI003748AB1D
MELRGKASEAIIDEKGVFRIKGGAEAYADWKVRDLEYMEGEQVLLEVSAMTGDMRFGLSGVHTVFHVSMLKKYHGDGNYIIRCDSVLLDESLSYEDDPIAILVREVHKLISKEISSIKVQWKNRLIEEPTLESEADMHERYPHLFTDSAYVYIYLIYCKGSEGIRKGKALEK